MANDLTYDKQDGIHRFIWHKSSRDVVDSFVEHLDNIMKTEGMITYLLIDFVESGLPPARYTVHSINNWRRQHLNDEASYTAIVYQADSTHLMILRALVPMMTRQYNSKVSFFTEDEREAAMIWLQGEQTEISCSS